MNKFNKPHKHICDQLSYYLWQILYDRYLSEAPLTNSKEDIIKHFIKLAPLETNKLMVKSFLYDCYYDHR